MSSLQDKYKTLIDAAKQSGVAGLEVREENNELYIDGSAPSASAGSRSWRSR